MLVNLQLVNLPFTEAIDLNTGIYALPFRYWLPRLRWMQGSGIGRAFDTATPALGIHPRQAGALISEQAFFFTCCHSTSVASALGSL